MAYNKGLHSGGSQKGSLYVLILLIIFGAALLGVMVLHRLRERRMYNLIVKQKDHQLLALQLLLQKEREQSKELSKKNKEMKAKVYAMGNREMELGRTIVEMQSTINSLKDEQKLVESAFEEKQNELRMMQQNWRNSGQGGSKILALRENLKRKEVKIDRVLKHRLESPVKTHSTSIDENPTIFPEIVATNGTMDVQDKAENDSKEKDENSRESAKHIINEDAGKSRLTEFEDGEVTTRMKEEIRTNEELGKKNEDPQDDGSAGSTTKDIDAKVGEDREKKAMKEDQRRELENNSQDFDVKQLSGMKRKHGHLSRTKGKHWRTLVNNKIIENSGIFESHGVINIGNRNKENREDGNDTMVDNTNHQVTNNGINIYPEKLRLDEMRQSEERGDDGLVQQNWSRRRINNARQIKSNMFYKEPEKLQVSDVQKQEKDAIDGGDDDDFFKDSQFEFEDEKEEYKEEIDESEFQRGL